MVRPRAILGSVLRGAALIAWLTSCQIVFPLSESDGGLEPDASLDAPSDAPACTPLQLNATLIDDTFLGEGNCGGAIRQGIATNMNIGQNGTSRVLLRFALDADIVAAIADGTITAGTLTLHPRPNDCDCTNAPTNFQVFAASDDWLEGGGTTAMGADYCNRQSTGAAQEWEVPGANGATDRSMIPLATRTVSAAELTPLGTPIITPLALASAQRDELKAWSFEGRLSLLLAPTAGGTLFLFTQDADPTKSATLAFEDCR